MKKTKFNLNNLSKLASKILYCGVLCFTLIVVFLSVIGTLAGEDIMSALPCSMLLWTLLFSFLTAIAFAISALLKSLKVNTVVNCAVHFVLTYISFLLVYVIGGGADAYLGKVSAAQNRVFSIIMMSFCFIGIYAVVGLIRMCAATIRHQFKVKNAEYENVYSEIETNNTDNN